MQIMPSSNGWSNAAASIQQSVSEGKTPQSNNRTEVGLGVDRLDASAKTNDRDANERYDGPNQYTSENESEFNDAANPTKESLLALPADDELPKAKLDLFG